MNKIPPNAAHATSAPDAITIYGADWCGDCVRAKAVLDDHKVHYDYVDLVEHEAGNAVVLARNNQIQKIPVIIFPDNTHLTEPSNSEIEAKLAALAANEVGIGTVEASDYAVVENRDQSRFELHQEGETVSFANFTERPGGVVEIPVVATEPQHRGKGNAGRLMEGLLAILRASDRTIVPVCSFAAHYIRENPQHQNLLAQNNS